MPASTTPPAAKNMASMATATAENLPLFYKNPRVLDRTLDAKRKIRRLGNYLFAQSANAIPMVIDEFPIAATQYPIVFLATAEPTPAIVTGVKLNTNLFINPEGQWETGFYVPAYVRRYPFILVDDPVNKQMVLCIDEGSSLLSDDGDMPLFENGKPSEITDKALQFCAALKQQGEMTDAFMKAVVQQKLLVERTIELEIPNSDKLSVSGFMTIDENRFQSMSDDVFTAWRHQGWIGLVYAHLLSQQRWSHLGVMAQQRG
jgi:hypothetical protein